MSCYSHLCDIFVFTSHELCCINISVEGSKNMLMSLWSHVISHIIYEEHALYTKWNIFCTNRNYWKFWPSLGSWRHPSVSEKKIWLLAVVVFLVGACMQTYEHCFKNCILKCLKMISCGTSIKHQMMASVIFAYIMINYILL